MNTRYGKTREQQPKTLIYKHLYFTHHRSKGAYQAVYTYQMALRTPVVVICYHIMPQVMHLVRRCQAQPIALKAHALGLGETLSHALHGSVWERLDELANTPTAVKILGVTRPRSGFD